MPSNYKADIKSISKTKQREITPKVRKPELSFLHATSCLVLFYISIQYHKKAVQHTERTQNQCKSLSNITKRDNTKSEKSRVVIFVHDTGLVLFYISTTSKYSEE